MQQINDYNKEIHHMLDLLHQSKYRRCLFTENCTEEVIEAHSVSRSILTRIQDNGRVIQPKTRSEKDESGLSHVNPGFNTEGINRASTGTFVCQTHDNAFRAIDTIPMNLDDPNVRDLLFYRAALREAWVLLRLRPSISWMDSKIPSLFSPSIHPATRLESLQDLIERMRPLLTTTNHAKARPPVEHIVRRVKSEHPILATSYASGGFTLAHDNTGTEISPSVIRARMGIEPNDCWGFTIIPQKNEHLILASWLRGSSAANYFTHLKEVNGKELEAAVSAELIYFCEGWFLNPRVWASYSRTKQEAIVSAYDNIPELISGKYAWRDKKERIPWYKYMNIPNRHQINLFSYDKSVLEDIRD